MTERLLLETAGLRPQQRFPCPLCGSAQQDVLYNLSNPTVHAHDGLKGVIVRCKSCSLMFKEYEKSILDIYDDTYADAYLGLDEYAESDSAKLLFRSILSRTKAQLNGKEGPTLLDVGSGIGTLLGIAKELGFRAKGVELAPKLAKVALAKGHETLNCGIAEMGNTAKVDVVTMMDVIEHLEAPRVVVEHLAGLLVPGGLLVVYTPNHDSLIVKIAHLLYSLGWGAGIENIFACTHTCFFTPQTLNRILVEAGFRITECTYFSYDTTRPGQQVSSVEKAIIGAIEWLGGILGTKGFRMVVYAAKSR